MPAQELTGENMVKIGGLLLISKLAEPAGMGAMPANAPAIGPRIAGILGFPVRFRPHTPTTTDAGVCNCPLSRV